MNSNPSLSFKNQGRNCFLYKFASIAFLLCGIVVRSTLGDQIVENAEIQGAEIRLGLDDGRDKGSKLLQRALVHSNSDVLEINQNGDFEGGVRVNGPVSFNINPDPNIPFYVYQGNVPTTDLFGSNYNIGITSRTTSGRSGFVAFTGNDWLNGAHNNAHYLSLFPFDIDPDRNGDREWKAFRLRVGSSAEDRFWVNVYGEGYFAGRLDVADTIRAEEVIVETGWSDYVFEEGCNLRPLSEVEAHIGAFGHLPGVPSAAEVAESGVSVGDSQRLLLEKVEELTLYLLEKEKEVAELRARVSALEGKLN